MCKTYFVMLLWIEFFVFLLKNWTEILKCQDTRSIINFVDEVMDLYLSRIDSNSPHCWQEWSITYFSISIPIKVVESFSVESSLCFIQIILISRDSKNPCSCAENFHFSVKRMLWYQDHCTKKEKILLTKTKCKNIPPLAFFPFCAIILQLKTKFSLIEGKRLTEPCLLTFNPQFHWNLLLLISVLLTNCKKLVKLSTSSIFFLAKTQFKYSNYLNFDNFECIAYKPVIPSRKNLNIDPQNKPITSWLWSWSRIGWSSVYIFQIIYTKTRSQTF